MILHRPTVSTGMQAREARELPIFCHHYRSKRGLPTKVQLTVQHLQSLLSSPLCDAMATGLSLFDRLPLEIRLKIYECYLSEFYGSKKVIPNADSKAARLDALSQFPGPISDEVKSCIIYPKYTFALHHTYRWSGAGKLYYLNKITDRTCKSKSRHTSSMTEIDAVTQLSILG